MVSLYALDVTKLPRVGEQQCLELLESLPLERQQKIKRCRKFEKKQQSLGAGLLLQRVLERYGIAEDAVYENANRKPMAEGICFNLSHTDGLVICAVSSLPVGCDVERVRRAPKHLVQRYFCENEKAHLKACDEARYNEAFFRLWTMKESYIKMTGEGMSIPLNAYEVQLENEVKILRNGKRQACSVREYHVSGYRIAVCAEEENFSEIIWENM